MKNLIFWIQKRARLIAFGLIILIVLGSSLLVIDFTTDHLLRVRRIDTGEVQAQELLINMRLYHQVIDQLKQDTSQPITGIEGLKDPFREQGQAEEEKETPAEE